MISRIFGMLRDVALVMFIGPAAWALDAFYFAFTIPNLFRRLLGEGALTAAFMPEFIQAREGGENGGTLASTVMTLLFVFTLGVTLIGSGGCYLAANYLDLSDKVNLALMLLAIMLPFAVFICTSALMGAILQALRIFVLPAAMSILLNLGILGALAFIGYQYWPVDLEMTFWQKLESIPLANPDRIASFTHYVAYAVLISGFMQLLIQYPVIRLCGIKLRPLLNLKSERFKTVLKNMGPAAIGLGIVQLNVLVDNLIAYYLSTDLVDGAYPYEGATSYLFLGNRLMQLPLGVFAIAVATAAFPALSSLAAKDQLEKFTTSLFNSLKMLLFVMLPAAVGLIVLSGPIIRLLYQSPDMEFSDAAVYRTAAVLCALAAGLAFFSMQQIMVRAFYSLRDYTTPVKIAVAMAGLNFGLNLLFIHAPDLYRHWSGKVIAGMPGVDAWGQGSLYLDSQGLALGEAGLAVATTVTAFLNVLLLWAALKRKLSGSSAVSYWSKKSEDFVFCAGRILASAVALGFLTYWTVNSIPYGPELLYRAERVVVPIVIAIFFYPMFCGLFVPAEYEAFMDKWHKRKSKV